MTNVETTSGPKGNAARSARSRRTLVLACAAAAATVVAAGTAAFAGSDRYAIHGDTRLDALKTKTTPRLLEVEAIFGPPSSIRMLDAWTCRLVWRNYGLAVLLFTVNREERPCERGEFARGTVVGHAWHTDAGLKIGDPVAKLQRLYPTARLHLHAGSATGWWLVPRHDCRPNGSGPFPGLLARTQRRHVSAFFLQVALCA